EVYVIICLRQSQFSTILTKMNKNDQDTRVVFLQTCMRHIDQFNETTKTVFLGVVEHGALRGGDNIICNKGRRIINLDAYQEQEKQFFSGVVNMERYEKGIISFVIQEKE